ncbi:hypothetical protein M8J76_003444 [Diaphorina citri]|nr:hypothetical protein M8J76_003444 [Diaphorina citri]
MDPKDLEIEARLQKLRNEIPSKSTTTDDQLAARLAGLKGPSNRRDVTEEDIANRLSNIKGNKNVPTESELEEKLARLKGGPIPGSGPVPNNNVNILVSKKKTDAEQVNDLLKQLVTETDIDSCITSSTTRLTDNRSSKSILKNSPFPVSSSSMKQETSALVEKLVAESKLTPYHESCSSDEEEENPTDDWCTICNEDATLKCKGCSGDLYCTSCYKEFHTPSDTEDDHKCERFVKTKKKARETAL